MSRFFPLFSGSSGNCTYIGSGEDGILIDAGVSARRMAKMMDEVGIRIPSLTGVFVTHEHSDHTRGLRVFAKKYHLPVYASPGTAAALRAQGLIDPVTPLIEIGTGRVASGTLTVQPFHISHDCREGYGYRIALPDGRLAGVATDMGYYSDEVHRALLGCDLVILESNHDVRMLQNGPYPYPLKQRILSDLGHLSNEACATALPKLVRNGTARIVLAHLSRENNLPELAYQTAMAELKLHGLLEHIDFELSVAPPENDGVVTIF